MQRCINYSRELLHNSVNKLHHSRIPESAAPFMIMVYELKGMMCE